MSYTKGFEFEFKNCKTLSITLSALTNLLYLVKSMIGGTGLMGLISTVSSCTTTTSTLSCIGYSCVINQADRASNYLF